MAPREQNSPGSLTVVTRPIKSDDDTDNYQNDEVDQPLEAEEAVTDNNGAPVVDWPEQLAPHAELSPQPQPLAQPPQNIDAASLARQAYMQQGAPFPPFHYGLGYALQQGFGMLPTPSLQSFQNGWGVGSDDHGSYGGFSPLEGGQLGPNDRQTRLPSLTPVRQAFQQNYIYQQAQFEGEDQHQGRRPARPTIEQPRQAEGQVAWDLLVDGGDNTSPEPDQQQDAPAQRAPILPPTAAPPAVQPRQGSRRGQPRYPTWTEEEVARVVQLGRAGYTNRQIAHLMGKTESAVTARRWRAAGGNPKGKGKEKRRGRRGCGDPSRGARRRSPPPPPSPPAAPAPGLVGA